MELRQHFDQTTSGKGIKVDAASVLHNGCVILWLKKYSVDVNDHKRWSTWLKIATSTMPVAKMSLLHFYNNQPRSNGQAEGLGDRCARVLIQACVICVDSVTRSTATPEEVKFLSTLANNRLYPASPTSSNLYMTIKQKMQPLKTGSMTSELLPIMLSTTDDKLNLLVTKILTAPNIAKESSLQPTLSELLPQTLSLKPLQPVLETIGTAHALILAANVIEASTKHPNQPNLLTFLLSITTFVKATLKPVTTKVHPAFGWQSCMPGKSTQSIPASAWPRVNLQLELLWSRPMIQTLFTPLLQQSSRGIAWSPQKELSIAGNTKFTKKWKELLIRFSAVKPIGKRSPLDAKLMQGWTLFTMDLRSYAIILENLTATLPSSRFSRDIASRLAFLPDLVPRCWQLMAAPLWGPSKESMLHNFLVCFSNFGSPHWQPDICLPILDLVARATQVLWTTLDQEDVYDFGYPIDIDLAVSMSKFCNSALVSLYQRGYYSNPSLDTVVKSTSLLFKQLLDQDDRRPFASADANRWVVPDLKRGIERLIQGTGKEPNMFNILSNCPHAFPFDSRVKMLRTMITSDQTGTQHLIIHRGSLLKDALTLVGRMTASQLRASWKITFFSVVGVQEPGVDQRGLFKDFLEECLKQLFDESSGLWERRGGEQPFLWPCTDKPDLYNLAGKLMGKAVLEGVVLDYPVARIMYAKILGRLLTLDDLPSLDPDLYQNLLVIKKFGDVGDVKDLELYFVVPESEVELKPGGGNLQVDNDNRFEYIHLLADYKLRIERQTAINAIVDGFKTAVKDAWFSLFSPSELARIVSGDSRGIDAAELKRYTKYDEGYFELHPTIILFWQCFDGMTPWEQGQLLRFATSCSKAPIGGFSQLNPPFTIAKMDVIEKANIISVFKRPGQGIQRLPTASTCFNLLRLPPYSDKKTMRDRLTTAIATNSSGFFLA
jgi:hypothetical protein